MVSQSPEGSTLDFHTRYSINIYVYYPWQCLNHPKGQRSISTEMGLDRWASDTTMSQPPEGAMIDFYLGAANARN